MQIDLSSFLAAIIDEAGGEVLIPYDTFLAQHGDKNITIDIIDDGQTIKLGLIDTKDIPEDVE
jgi:hypothetical protein